MSFITFYCKHCGHDCVCVHKVLVISFLALNADNRL
jgi:hypothetical protein